MERDVIVDARGSVSGARILSAGSRGVDTNIPGGVASNFGTDHASPAAIVAECEPYGAHRITMRDVSLTLIQTFFVVAREGSFSAAARALNMSNQSAANHVRRLEQIFGERLLLSERGAQSVTLTARGRRVYRLLKARPAVW